MARTFEFVLHFVGCVTVTVSPNQIIIIIIINSTRSGVILALYYTRENSFLYIFDLALN